MKYITLLSLVGILSFTNACTYLEATNETVDYIDSHDAYGEDSYEHDREICWVITVEEGFAVALWSDTFHLESRYDTLEIYCGQQGHEGYIGEYSGFRGINENTPVHTNGEAMLVEFFTDHSIAEDGFRLNYTAVPLSEAEGGDCGERHEGGSEEEHYHYGAGAVAGIVFGVILLLAFLGVVAACVVCFVCSIKTRPQRVVGNYPMNNYPGMTPVGASGAAAAGTAGMVRPPAYPGHQQAGPGQFASPAGQPQLYGQQQRKDPNQLGQGYGAPPPQEPANGTMSPPPNYEPEQTTGHF